MSKHITLISQIIEQLENVKKEQGDMPITLNDEENGFYNNFSSNIFVVKMKEDSNGYFIEHNEGDTKICVLDFKPYQNNYQLQNNQNLENKIEN